MHEITLETLNIGWFSNPPLTLRVDIVFPNAFGQVDCSFICKVQALQDYCTAYVRQFINMTDNSEVGEAEFSGNLTSLESLALFRNGSFSGNVRHKLPHIFVIIPSMLINVDTTHTYSDLHTVHTHAQLDSECIMVSSCLEGLCMCLYV